MLYTRQPCSTAPTHTIICHYYLELCYRAPRRTVDRDIAGGQTLAIPVATPKVFMTHSLAYSSGTIIMHMKKKHKNPK